MRALITGVTGQDGSYLAEHLDESGWEVWGLVRSQSPRRERLRHLWPDSRLVEGDLLDQSSLQNALAAVRPDVVFNLAAMTYVGMSWAQPAVMAEVTGLGALRLLEAVRAIDPDIRVVHASSSEMFGNPDSPVQDENTPLRPVSPYGVAKTFAHHCVLTARASHGLHASTVIMFNHESPRRGTEFVTRKVSLAAAAIRRGEQDKLTLGRLDTQRDWGWAPDYMRALPLVAALSEPDDFVLATGETHSVAELCEAAFAAAGLRWTDHVVTDYSLYRPSELWALCGDASKARDVLGWEPRLRFAQIVRLLIGHDLMTVS